MSNDLSQEEIKKEGKITKPLEKEIINNNVFLDITERMPRAYSMNL